MADDKRVVRTAGVYGTFIVGDITITPEGVEVSRDEWLTIAESAVVNQVVVRLDEDFPQAPVPAGKPSGKPGGDTKTEG